ncbi:YkvA family protein [Algoriphagus sp. D3-2-R+10]|uniref:YkvA family protein n=1 Tax=Algoriphagus aurantiacus TaxID=3103948 RepID=UPI002B3EB517|nr:YkvA family protein [Algoriphagus sp. D3-2-R+10]MEB2777210.1 YkvA family protein [Algoriphagus sp. D3-2-R+10]
MGSFKSKTSVTIENAKALFGKQVDALGKQKEKVSELIAGVGNKILRFGDNPRVKKLIEPVSVFIRMIKAHFNGSHKLTNSTLGLILLALVYFVSPIDIIPDFLGVIGFADDLSVILAIYAKVKDEIDGFLDWERTQI